MGITDGFITLDYRDGKAYANRKSYPAGYFAVDLMNKFHENDAAAKLAALRETDNGSVLDQLREGYMNVETFVLTARNLEYAIDVLPNYKPFDTMNTKRLRDTVNYYFTDENAYDICRYLRYKGHVAELMNPRVPYWSPSQMVKPAYRKAMESLLDDVCSILHFFNDLPDDLTAAHDALQSFWNMLDETETAGKLEHLDESHLLPLAFEAVGEHNISLSVRYVPLPKIGMNKSSSAARRMTFTSYYSFILTDFFEGLHAGNYLRRCPICKDYFLVEGARRQIYCTTGYAPELYRGRKLTCRQYAAAMHRKEGAADDPIIDRYTRRCNAIRAEKSRRTITPAFAEEALLLARDRKYQALTDEIYANTDYETDMSRDKLYADVRARSKQ